MFPSFTGSSRRPRQVNLSGRTNNPFAAFPGASPTRPSPHASSPQSAVAIAQQERIQRQRDRDKQNASRTIQRVWRGHRGRERIYGVWRAEWDANEKDMTDIMDHALDASKPWDTWTLSRRPTPYATADQCLGQLRLLVQFVSARRYQDVLRLAYFADAFEQTFRALPTIATEGEWTKLLKRLAKMILGVLATSNNISVPVFTVEPLLRAVIFLTGLIPKQMARMADTYYNAMAFLTTKASNLRYPGADEELDNRGLYIGPEKLNEGVVALLKPITSETMAAYESFATSYLTIANLEAYLGPLEGLASQINYKMLALAVSACLDSSIKHSRALENIQARAWLLSYLIFFQRSAFGSQDNLRGLELDFVGVVSGMLNSIATYLMQGLEAEDVSDTESPTGTQPLHPFIKEQVAGLISQNCITGLLSRIRTSRPPGAESVASDAESHETRILATYALNLLRIFPRRGDDIRMWLYLGSASSGQPDVKVPAIKYFWQASRASHVFEIISNDPTKVLSLLQLDEHAKMKVEVSQQQREQEWTTILLFLELYTFLLKVMDDDEFFSSTSAFVTSETTKISWTRESALPLSDIKDLTVFLKNLAFTLYWNAADLSEPEVRPPAASLRSYFSGTTQATESSDLFPGTQDMETKGQTHLPGVTGIPLEYFKGLVTGLLRMIHERE